MSPENPRGQDPGVASRRGGCPGRRNGSDNRRVSLYRDEGVVLRAQKLGEADRIVTLLTRERGKVRAVAKGVRKYHLPAGLPGRAVHARRPPAVSRAGRWTSSPRRRRSARTACRWPPTTAGTRPGRRCSRRPTGSWRTSASRPCSCSCCWRARCGLSPRGGTPPGLVLDAYLLRALAVAGWAPSFTDCARCGASGPHLALSVAGGRERVPAVPPGRVGRAAPGDAGPAGGPAFSGDWTAADASGGPPPAPGQRDRGGLPAMAPGAAGPVAAPGGALSWWGAELVGR